MDDTAAVGSPKSRFLKAKRASSPPVVPAPDFVEGSSESGTVAAAAITDTARQTDATTDRRNAKTNTPPRKKNMSQDKDKTMLSDKLDLNLNSLMKLRSYFFKEETDGEGDSLELDEFIEAFGDVLGDGSTREELENMFMKIDANSDGGVDWEEFTNFIILVDQGAQSMQHDADLADFMPAPDTNLRSASLRHPHREMINRILIVDRPTKTYVSCSRDGIFHFWNPTTMVHIKTINHPQALNHYERSVLNKKIGGQTKHWVSDVVWMSLCNRLAVASVDRSITFYDLVSNELVSRIGGLPHAPVSLAYTVTSADGQVLAFGDTGGCLHVYKLDKDFDFVIGNDGKPRHVGIVKHDVRRIHRDWIVCLSYVRDLELLVSCSLDTYIKFFDIGKAKVLRTFKGHDKGVYSFDWCQSGKFIASCGMARSIRLWNPYTMNVVATLAGHAAPVSNVAVDDGNHKLISLSMDKTIKCWDCSTFQCLQTILDPTKHRPEDRISALIWDNKHQVLLTSSNHISVWKIRKRVVLKEQKTLKSHEAPLCSALFNKNFHQVVSGDDASCVQVWSLASGEMVFRFQHAHGNSKITSMSFDDSMRRLLTGAHDGTIKMWNFSNGQCLCEYLRDADAASGVTGTEVTAVRYLVEAGGHYTGNGEVCNRFVVSTGWDRKIHVFLDEGEEEEVEPLLTMPRNFKGQSTTGIAKHYLGHTDDVLCLAHCPPLLVASGSYDGVIILWSMETGLPRFELCASDYDEQAECNVDVSPSVFSLSNNGDEGVARREACEALTRVRRHRRQSISQSPPPEIINVRQAEAVQKGPAATTSSSSSKWADVVQKPRESWVKAQNAFKFATTKKPHRPPQRKPRCKAHIDMLCRNARLASKCGSVIRAGGEAVVEEKQPDSHRQPEEDDGESRRPDDGEEVHDAEASALRGGGDRQHDGGEDVAAAAAVPDGPDGGSGSGIPEGLDLKDARAIECVVYLRQKHCLISSGADGNLRFWNVRNGRLISTMKARHPKDESVTCCQTDERHNSYLFTTCSGGYVKVWGVLNSIGQFQGLHRRISRYATELSGSPGSVASAPTGVAPAYERAVWKAHSQAVVSIEFIETSKKRDGPELLLTASTDCNVSLWTLQGAHIGVFGGQMRHWVLGNPSTWVNSRPASLDVAQGAGGDESAATDALNAMPSHLRDEQQVSLQLANEERQRKLAQKEQNEKYYQLGKARLDRRLRAHNTELMSMRNHRPEEAAGVSGVSSVQPVMKRTRPNVVERVQTIRTSYNQVAHLLKVHKIDAVPKSVSCGRGNKAASRKLTMKSLIGNF